MNDRLAVVSPCESFPYVQPPPMPDMSEAFQLRQFLVDNQDIEIRTQPATPPPNENVQIPPMPPQRGIHCRRRINATPSQPEIPRRRRISSSPSQPDIPRRRRNPSTASQRDSRRRTALDSNAREIGYHNSQVPGHSRTYNSNNAGPLPCPLHPDPSEYYKNSCISEHYTFLS